MLRTVFVLAVIVYGCVKSIQGPFYALLFYLWIAYFRPESWLWWDFFSQLNLSFIVGIFVLIAAVLNSSERIRWGLGPILMVLLLGQSLISTLVSPYSAYAWPYWQDFAKSTVVSFLIVSLVKDERRLRLTFLVIAFSLGLEMTKQGWAQLILNPGAVNANEHPAIGDNNAVAIAAIMLMSFVMALARSASTRKEGWLLRLANVGIVYRAVSTYSRGGFLAIAAVGLHYLGTAKQKAVGAIAVGILVGAIASVLPDEFWDRMGTIRTGAEDVESADVSTRGRIHFWQTAVLMANDRPLTGVGHNVYGAAYANYDTSGEYGTSRSVHSAWFGIFAELGYPGLVLFGSIVLLAFVNCRRAQRLAKRHPELKNLGAFANAIEGALLAFTVGSLFVIFQYTELLWHTLALSMALDRIVAERVKAIEGSSTQVSVKTAAPLGFRGAAIVATRPVRVASHR